SYIRSQAIPPRRPSLQENLLSYESRNFNFIKCERFSSPKLFGAAMASNLLLKLFDAEKLAEVRQSVISISEANIAKWLLKRDASQVKALMTDLDRDFDIMDDISRFKLMVKRDAKVKLDDSCLSKHPPAQNIMFHRKALNAVYSPCFDEFKNRFLYCLPPNIVFFTEMTNEDLAEIIRRRLGDDDIYNIGEVDFSKFDKSQDVFIKEYERALYEAFGFDVELLEMWMEGEYNAYASTMDSQLSFRIENQRRSGGSNTWIGNSLVTLGLLSMYYDVSKFRLLLISGDDSLIYSDEKIKDHSSQICLETGFETKFLSPSVPYFCSKFVVQTGSMTYFVPDPYKLLVKLGGSTPFVTDVDLFEAFVSFRDLTRAFDHQVMLERLCGLVHTKYCFTSGSTLPALCAIHCIRANFSSFKKLYPKTVGWWLVTSSRLKFLSKLPGLIVSKAFSSTGESNYFCYLRDSFADDPG
ncbi:polymerase, partial [Raspberry leaf mottle virus]